MQNSSLIFFMFDVSFANLTWDINTAASASSIMFELIWVLEWSCASEINDFESIFNISS